MGVFNSPGCFQLHSGHSHSTEMNVLHAIWRAFSPALTWRPDLIGHRRLERKPTEAFKPATTSVMVCHRCCYHMLPALTPM
jgi:hypothetical protein